MVIMKCISKGERVKFTFCCFVIGITVDPYRAHVVIITPTVPLNQLDFTPFGGKEVCLLIHSRKDCAKRANIFGILYYSILIYYILRYDDVICYIPLSKSTATSG